MRGGARSETSAARTGPASATARKTDAPSSTQRSAWLGTRSIDRADRVHERLTRMTTRKATPGPRRSSARAASAE